MISLGETDIVVDNISNHLFEDNREYYPEGEYEDDELLYRPTTLYDFWMDGYKRQNKREKISNQRR